jgi:RNA polymerase sigma factor (sigma-70 family)
VPLFFQPYPTLHEQLHIFIIKVQVVAIDEHTLIQGCCLGDRCSQEALYNLYARKMLGVCMWYATSRQEAEEILQDGFVRVFRYIPKFKRTGTLERWIRKIMVNAALFRFRTKSKSGEYFISENTFPDISTESCGFDILESKELLELIQDLTPMYRMVFNLHVLEGMKHREIASLLGISEGTSKSNLADARNVLQKKFKRLYFIPSSIKAV